MGVELTVKCICCGKDKLIYCAEEILEITEYYIFKCDCGIHSHFLGTASTNVDSISNNSLEAKVFERVICNISEFPEKASVNPIVTITNIQMILEIITYVEWLGSKESDKSYIVTLDNPLTNKILSQTTYKKLQQFAGKRIILNLLAT